MAGTTNPLMKPMSVKEIVTKAVAYEFNPHIALKYWLRTADTLLKEAQIYEREDNFQQAYLLLMRWVSLITDNLPQHPDAKEPENKRSLRFARSALPGVIGRLETLKPKIQLRYEIWQEGSAREGVSGSTSSLTEVIPPALESDQLAESDPAIAGNSSTLDAAENRELAVQLAHSEIRRRDAARRATRQHGISEEEERDRRVAGLWDDWETNLSKDGQSNDEAETRQRMDDTRRRIDGLHDFRTNLAVKKWFKSNLTPNLSPSRSPNLSPSRSPNRSPNQSPNRPMQISQSRSGYRYPSVYKSQPLQYEERQADTKSSTSEDYLPPVPQKEILHDTQIYSDVKPIRPEKQPINREPSPTPSPVEETTTFTFRPSAYLENGSPLRTVWLPPDLRERFLSIAASNTRANLETCGILCGTLISNALFISRLVIPEQESTSDTCDTINESVLFDYCDSEDLMVLGWIHTHPTQTCFMSSRDLHTHCGYQVMMPESIAIVCAPSKHPSWGVFRLTDPPGMQSVLSCRQTGLFHPHAEENVYTDALRPGHVFEAKGLNFEVVDLRPGH